MTISILPFLTALTTGIRCAKCGPRACPGTNEPLKAGLPGDASNYQHMKNHELRTRRITCFGYFSFSPGRRGILIGIGNEGQSAVIQFIADLDTHVGIPGYVGVPTPTLRICHSRTVQGSQVQLPIGGDTIRRYRVWNQILGAGLKLRFQPNL